MHMGAGQEYISSALLPLLQGERGRVFYFLENTSPALILAPASVVTVEF